MKKNFFAAFLFVVYVAMAGVWFDAVFADIVQIAHLS